MNPNIDIDETLSTIEVMLRQEAVYSVSDYLSQLPASTTLENPVDVSCRMVMAKWCSDICTFCHYGKETVQIAMSCLDRFMASPEGYSVLLDRSQFQLAVMTALYTSVKIHEHEAMDPKLVSKLSRGAHSAKAVEAMESRLLNAIGWRVNPPTSMSFVRQILDLVPEHLLPQAERETVIELAQLQVELAMESYDFCMMSASSIAMASLFNAVESVSSDGMFISDFEDNLCELTKIDNASLRQIRIYLYESVNGIEAMDVQFETKHTECEPRYCAQNANKRPSITGESPRSVSM